MESWHVPGAAPDKGRDTLRVATSVRNAVVGVQMQHRDPQSWQEMAPSWAARPTGSILLLVPCGTAGLESAPWVQVAVALQILLLFLSAVGTASVCLSICGFSLQQDSAGTRVGGHSPRWPQKARV